MSQWETLNMEDKIRGILRNLQTYAPDEFGMMYVSPYQIAIELDEETRAALGMPVGGAGAGPNNSIAQYIAHQLSLRIKSGEITDIEGAWLAKQHTHEVSFKHGEQKIVATGGVDAVISMFRLRS